MPSAAADPVFEWLERAYDQRDAGVTLIKGDRLFRTLHRRSTLQGVSATRLLTAMQGRLRLRDAAINLARSIQENVTNLCGWLTAFKVVTLKPGWNVVLLRGADTAPLNVVF